mgnify:CR=1 FL=1
MPLHRPHAQAIVRHLEATTDFLLLDMSTELSEATRLLLPECDSIVVIVEPQRAALSLADALLSNMMSKLKIPGSRISVVVVNRTHSAASYTLEAVESALQYEIAGVVPPAAELSFEATQRGMPMVLVHPNSTLAIQVQAIASHLVDKMQ